VIFHTRYLFPSVITRLTFISQKCTFYPECNSVHGAQSHSSPLAYCHYSAFTTGNQRKFNLTVESQEFNNVDIFKLAGGSAKAVTLSAILLVDDGFVSISVLRDKYEPKINGIEIKKALPHIAHSVSNGPYRAVDSTNVGFASVTVDGSESHTHGIDLVLNQWIWKKGSQIIGTGEITNFILPVGTHDIALTVVDTGNHTATEATTVTVNPFGYPDISTLTPSSGSIVGGEVVTIKGTGFTYSVNETIVYFGIDQFTGSAIQIINSTTIIVQSPTVPISVPVQVSVQTPLGRSEETTFTYVSSTPISFSATKLLDFIQPTSAEFGPDGKLYVGTLKGTLAKITMNADYTSVVGIVSAIVQPNRAILGITFDPMDAGSALPPVYISSSLLFHGESKSSSGTSINGKISRITGANLDIIEDVVTGLPVCDLDHGKCNSVADTVIGWKGSVSNYS
jgi:IPT/TIG domain